MKSLFKQLGGTYRKESGYDIPNLEVPDTKISEIGIYGQEPLYFLQHYRRVTYISLLTSGNINEYLAQNITEQLKANNPIKWTEVMNGIRQQAEENILKEMIYN